jgi:hypothetical protein
MKRSVSLCLVFLVGVAFFSFGSVSQQAMALTLVQLRSPADSSKVTTGTPTFQWDATSRPSTEKPTKFQIQLATDINFNTIIWDDSTIAGTATTKVYDGAIPLVQWTAYYWRMRVQVDSVRVAQNDTINYWQEDYSLIRTFFYTTATLINVPNNVSTIQTGIYWAASGDTILVEPNIYYENLRFHKKKVLLTSHYLYDSSDTSTVNSTIIDGSKLTRGETKGSVVFFTSAVDSFSTLRGFTIRGGTGSELTLGADKRVCGGGIVCDVGSTPTISYNVITGNHVQHDGGGIFINSGAPNILYNIITDNSTVEGAGAGIECRFSIQVETAPSLGRTGQSQESDDLSSPTADPEMSEEQIENSLYPRDATQVNPVSAPPMFAKPTENTKPVALFEWYARKNTIIQRDKYLPGDTLFFDGTISYDPDDGDDYITYWQWRYFRDYRCDREPSASPISFSSDSVAFLPITESSQLGIIRVYLEVRDTSGFSGQAFSADTVEINVQYPPHADAVDDFTGIPDSNVYLDGSASCDINPDDVLEYTWTQVSGYSVSIINVDSAKAYFVPQGTASLGDYTFQLKVSDGLAADSVTVTGVVSTPPVPVCQRDPAWGDTLVGYDTTMYLILDGCASYDPDSLSGDSVASYTWTPVTRGVLTKEGWQYIPLTGAVVLPRTYCSKQFKYFVGGIMKVRLKVRDTFQVESTGYDSVLFSVQMPPVADAGRDTVFRTTTISWLKGRAIETNPDQRAGMKYQWFVKTNPGGPLNLSPSAKSDSISFVPSAPGTYVLQLQVNDGLDASPLDEVTFQTNTPPVAVTRAVAHAIEGTEVALDASLSYDPDSSFYGKVLSYSWILKTKPANADPVTILDPNQSIARFVPYGTGQYVFRVVVHDTLSKKQPLDSTLNVGNVAFLNVTVDSTYAYPIIKGNLIARNVSGERGGGIDCNQSSPNIFENIFYENQSQGSGGGICARSYSTPQIKKNIFFGNISSDSTGGAIADLKDVLSPSATRGFRRYATIDTNSFWTNAGGAMYQTSGNINGNIYSFPRLVDPDFGDFTLDCSSPCQTLGIGKLPFFQPCANADHLSMISLSMLQNPVATAAAHFVINTDAPLKAEPVAFVEIGDNQPSPVYFTPVSPRCFRGTFIFTSSGDAQITVQASSVLEKDTSTVKDFNVQLIPGGGSGTLISSGGLLWMSFPQGSVEQDVYATCISVSDDPTYDFQNQPDLEALGEAYQLGPAISFDRELTVGFALDRLNLGDRTKALFSVFKYEDGKWGALDSYLEGNSVCADVKQLGVYRLVYDPAGKHAAGKPTSFALYQNCPNPFNPETQIKYDLPVSGHVNLAIYNVLGQKVRVLVDEVQDAGRKSVRWDGHDENGRDVASGIYFYKIKVENFEKIRKMVLIK